VRDDAGCQPSRLSGLYCRSKVVEAPGRPTLPALVRPAPGRAGWCPARQPPRGRRDGPARPPNFGSW